MTDGLFANPLHWAILLVIVLIIFGPGKLPSVGNALGKSIKEFKKASQDDVPPAGAATRTVAEPIQAPAPSLSTALATASPTACAQCGRENPADGSFCSGCGASLSAKPAEPEVVAAAVPVRLTCSKCGTENHATNRFCLHCGQVVEQMAGRV